MSLKKNAPVPLLDTRRQHAALQDQIEAVALAVLRSGQYVLGPAVADLERGVADYCGTRHAIGCASGSDALLLALMAAGIGPGDEVIVPSFTFFATASAATRLGAKVIFADVDPRTLNLDPQEVARRITPATRAIIPVHLFGHCADIAAIQEVVRKSPATGKVMIVEDACQAIGAERAGRRAGSMGDVGCLSFYPTKNLGGPGDGGMLTTNDDQLAERLRLLRAHGMQPRYHHHVVGINSRLDTIQAAILAVKLPYLDRWTDARAQHAARYAELFAAAGLPAGAMELPTAALASAGAGLRHVWNQYVVRVANGRRDALREHLTNCKIGTEIYYPISLHQQTCFQPAQGRAISLPHSERAAGEVLALPVAPEMTDEEQETVVAAVCEFFHATATSAAPSTAAAAHSPIPAPTFLKGPSIQQPNQQRV
ncbi:MAG: DegT/DnrJ/EryC1/StrS family aminotransferase [Planctomycetia bacterium]|nr:DegT/DnrJ/EryC1/StrS family aminotransferase [Planctomycetia bacterium]